MDINGATYDIYLWLQENSYKYGFIFRYSGNKTHITNVAEEVWHYRYVGKEAAAEIHERGICLEEYLENPQSQNANDQSLQERDSQELPVQDDISYELRNGVLLIHRLHNSRNGTSSHIVSYSPSPEYFKTGHYYINQCPVFCLLIPFFNTYPLPPPTVTPHFPLESLYGTMPARSPHTSGYKHASSGQTAY